MEARRRDARAGGAGRRAPSDVLSPAAALTLTLALVGAALPGGSLRATETGNSGPAAGGVLDLSRAGLEARDAVPLPAYWRFHPGDDALLAAPGVDDSGWPLVSTTLRDPKAPFVGRAVFRLRLLVPAGLVGQPLALRLRQAGASELLLDGAPVAAWGDLAEGIPGNPAASAIVVAGEGAHVLAVRFVAPAAASFRRSGVSPGFSGTIGLAARALPAEIRTAAVSTGAAWLFTGVFVAFAILHAALGAFHRRAGEHLWFALLCAANASFAWFLLARATSTDPRFFRLAEPVLNVTGLVFALSLVLFVREAFGSAPGRRAFVVGSLSLVVLACWGIGWPAAANPAVFVVMLAACLEAIRAAAAAVVRGRPGARLVGAGVGLLAAGFAVGLLVRLHILGGGPAVATFVPLASVLVMLLFSSVHLSSRFAAISRELARRLAEVERLSAEKLEGERRARAEELSRRLLAAEMERKTAELEEARRLQTSMLPRELPALSELAVAARMTTATEVGGDYYDFDVAESGEVTVAVGDATGHGLRAGTLVTATKGLFGVLSREPDLRSVLSRSAASIRRMNLRALAMALTLVRVRKGILRVSAAGMPPLLVHRAASGAIEAVAVPGMPLGASARLTYGEAEMQLAVGDTVLLMSDGLPERLDPEDEMLGYERTAALFAAAAPSSPDDIADELLAGAEAFARGRPPEDDVTIVVLRRLS
ncbi:MAG: SpoIIE family protein phosphatase [Thermoanaerobaculia bacterium]